MDGAFEELRGLRLDIRNGRRNVVVQIAPEIVELLIVAAPRHIGRLEQNGAILFIDNHELAVEPLVEDCTRPDIAGDRGNEAIEGRLRGLRNAGQRQGVSVPVGVFRVREPPRENPAGLRDRCRTA